HRSLSFSSSATPCAYADVQMLAWLCGTILDRAVVPDVGTSSAVSLALTGSSADGPPWPPAGVKRPAISFAAAARSTTRRPRASATRRDGQPQPAGAINARGCRSAKYLPSSSAPYAGFSGTHAALAATVRIATANSGPFGSTTAIRS